MPSFPDRLSRAEAALDLVLVQPATGRAAAEAVLAERGDDEAAAVALRAVGLSWKENGDLTRAGRALRQAIRVADRAAAPYRAGEARMSLVVILADLGWVARLTGDIPAALDRSDTAAALYTAHGKRGTSLFTDKADMLLTVGLAGEARATAAAAIADLEANGFRYNLAESHLYLARAALADDDPAEAEGAARTARLMFGRQHRGSWADLARQVEVAARFAQGERSAGLLREAASVADRLQAAKWPVAPYEARLLAGRIALDLGRGPQARTLFAEVARHRSRGVAEIRTLAWHAHALHALSAGRPAAAERALQAGLRVHAENNAVLGATDLRAHASARGEELATLGLRLALERGDARAVLRWAETWRAASLRRRPVRPPDDAQLAADLAALRRVVAEIPTKGTAPTGAS